MHRTTTITILIIFESHGESWSTAIFFPDKPGVGGVSLLANLFPPDGLIMKAYEYGMVVYLMKISDPKYPFF